MNVNLNVTVGNMIWRYELDNHVLMNSQLDI